MAVNKLDITMMEDVGTSASQLLQRDGSGNIPALDGSQLIGVTEFTTLTSDPAIDTNPAGGVGTLWYNKTGGEMYVCTDATAGENVWINVGAGSGNVQQGLHGEAYGYCAGGGNPVLDVVDKYSFTSDSNAVDVGNLTAIDQGIFGHQSKTKGYAIGGGETNIEVLVFASGGNMVNQTGSLQVNVNGVATGISSFDHGYRAAGLPAGSFNGIERFPFASDSNGSDHGDIASARAQPTGTNSFTHGYCMKGYTGTTGSNIIDKFAFASNVTGTDVGDATNIGDSFGGCSSETYGYCHGGNLYATGGWAYHNVIQKVSFTSDANAIDVGDLLGNHGSQSGTSSETYGYIAGGGPPNLNTILKHSFITDGNATDVADLTASRRDTAGFHV